MWMDLESVIQSEVAQRERNKYQILTNTQRIMSTSIPAPTYQNTA